MSQNSDQNLYNFFVTTYKNHAKASKKGPFLRLSVTMFTATQEPAVCNIATNTNGSETGAKRPSYPAPSVKPTDKRCPRTAR